jgi:hypothetical protein
MPTFEITRGDATYEVEAPDVPTAVRDLDTQLGVKAPAPGTTVDDIGTGIKSGITTGAISALPSIPALAYDVVRAPGQLVYRAADAIAGQLGYDKHYEENLAPGGLFAASRAVGDFATKTADQLVDAPKSAGGKITRAVTGAGIEALGGSGVFKVLGLAGRFFTNYDDAVAAAQAIGVAPAKAIQAVNEAGIEALAKQPVANAAYSAAAGGGGEIAEQQGAPPIVGALLGTAAAAGGHAAVRGGAAGVRAIGEQIDETLTRTPEIRDRKAAAALREAAKNPEALDEWARRGETGELVPGSKPTLYEAAGEDRGIGAEQRRQRMGNPVYKIEEEERRAAQNVARVEELKRLGGEGTPEEILTEFRKQRDEMDASTAAAERMAQDEAATAATRAGTAKTPEAVGTAIREPLVAAERAAKEEGGRLYDAIAAEGVTVGTGRLKAAVGKEFRDIPESPLSGDEKHFADLIKGYGGRLEFDLLQKLRSEVAGRARQFTLPDTVRRRFTLLKNAIDQAMDDGLAKALDADPSLMQRATANVPIDDALTQQQRAANTHWREMKQTFGAEPVKPIVAKAPTASGFKMTEAKVPEAAFRPGNTGGEHLRALRAAGATDAALTEAAALSLQQTAIRDGVIDPGKFRNWVDRHLPAIRELPPAVQQRFSSASTATRALEAATTARKAALKEFDESAVGKALGIPVENLQKAISSYLENPNATNQLAAAVAGNPAAKEGLQRLAAENILGRFRSASDDLSKAALTTWIDRNMKQLKTIYGAENARRFQRLVDDIERSRRLLTVGKDPAGPGTAGDIASMGKRAMGATVMSIISMGGGPKGVLIAGIAGAAKAIGAAMKTAGLQSVDEVLAQALLDPELARKLLTKAPALKNEKFRKGLGTTILRSSLAGMAYGGNQ